MMRGMFSAISGLKNHQVMLDVTANDIANVNTIGYKSARTTFKDSLTQLQRGASGSSGANGGTNAAQVGLGVGLGSIDNMMTGGALQSTGNPLDVAIQGEGFFAVAQAVVTSPATGIPAGTNAQYTRAGNFTTNTDGYLLTQEGFYVLGRTAAAAGAPDTLLRVPPGGTNVAEGRSPSVSPRAPTTLACKSASRAITSNVNNPAMIASATYWSVNFTSNSVVETTSDAMATLGTKTTRRNVSKVIWTSIFGCSTKTLSLALAAKCPFKSPRGSP